MSTLTLTAGSVAAFPRVNLLPPEIEETRRFRRVQLGLGATVTGAVAIVGLLYTVAAGSVSDAQTELDASTATRAGLQADAARYADVPAVFAAVDDAEARLDQAMSQEVRWSRLLNELTEGTPKSVWLTDMTVQTNGVATESDASGTSGEVDPLAPAGIGSITFAGRALTHPDVASWLTYLGKQKGYAGAFLTSSELVDVDGRKVAAFQSTVVVTDEALASAEANPSDGTTDTSGATNTGTSDTGSQDGE